MTMMMVMVMMMKTMMEMMATIMIMMSVDGSPDARRLIGGLISRLPARSCGDTDGHQVSELS
jgi:hypothetical protein